MAPTTVSSLVTRLVERVPFKVICIISLFIPFTPFMTNVHYYSQRSHTPSGMCSPRYPGYSKVLDMLVTLPDGGVQAGGWQYPPGAVWWNSGVAHGCPCSVGPCIRPCCPDGYYTPYLPDDYTLFQIVCSDILDVESEKSKPLRVLSLTDHKMVPTSRRHFPVLEANCGGAIDFVPLANLTTEGQVLEDGVTINPATYGICFIVRDDLLLSPMVHQCASRALKDDNGHYRDVRMAVIDSVVQGSTALLLMASLVTYLLVPHLLPKHCSGSVICYIITLIVYRIIEIPFFWSQVYYPNFAQYIGAVVHSWVVTEMMWQGLIVYQMWATFSPHKLRVPNSGGENNRFLWYSVAIWGTAVFITLFSIFIPGIHIKGYLLYAVLFVNLCLTLSTLLRLRACLKASKITRGSGSQRHNAKEFRWTSLFLKFSFVTNLEYTLVILFGRVTKFINPVDSRTSHLTGVLTYLLNLWGVEIFFVNVWNKRTWKELRTRFISRRTSKNRIK